MRRSKTLKLHPVERAIAKARWASLLTTAELHLAASSDMTKIIESSLSLLYIVGLAAHRSGLDIPEVRIIAGSCRTALAAIASESLTPQQMETLESGLAAARRLKPLVKESHFIEASIQASLLIRSRGVNWGDFEQFLTPTKT